MGHAFMSFVNALMTFEPQYTAETNKLLNRASESLEKVFKINDDAVKDIHISI